MSTTFKAYGDVEGPLGFPMLEQQAQQLDELLKAHPGYEYQRAKAKAAPDLLPGERADVSWIQTEAIDADHEIVLASGFKDDIFRLNPVVTLNHNYWNPPIGKSVWRQRLKESDRRGIKAKTTYPTRPEEWPLDQPWPSDPAWALVKAGLMNGKSIGFLTLTSHAPTDEEIKRRPELAKVRRIIDEWMLVEYCCCWAPSNSEAVVEATAKSGVSPLDLKAFGIEPAPPKDDPAKTEPIIVHTSLDEVAKAVSQSLAAIDLDGIAKRVTEESYHRLKGQM